MDNPELQPHIKQALQICQRAERMIDTVDRSLVSFRDAHDRVPHCLQDSYTFNQGQNQSQVMMLNVPAAFAFEATRLVCYPEIRIISIDEETVGPSELTFRSTIWSMEAIENLNESVDGLIELTYAEANAQKRKRPLQNSGFFVSQMQTLVAQPGNVERIASEGTPQQLRAGQPRPGGLVFEPPLWMPRGSSLQVAFTPLFSGTGPAPTTDTETGRLYEYRIRVVLEGSRIVDRGIRQ